ncbi:MAG: 16S rRNA (cytosine(1402)-N(4))-methyltransferase RsmH [Bradymonadaceae bacterium]|nr:16S rRNA (cytosine(1402)-N(4))-methyltransferase RsmH [Lujinxingiaceae bacterium]
MSSNSTPYASDYHVPVLVHEVLAWLAVVPGGRYVDGTLGGGGHTAAILDASAPDGLVLAIDRDPEAIAAARARLGEQAGRVIFVEGNYANATEIVAEAGFGPVDGFLVDAGISSHQIDTAERGFSFSRPGPLDMRMGRDTPSLEEYLQNATHGELAYALRTYGDIRSASRVAAAILDAFAKGSLETTADLRECAAEIVGRGAGSGRKTGIDPSTLVFQALRIAVNREIEHLELAVAAVPKVVRPGGRAVFISFHSVEDRVVKHGFRELSRQCICPPGLPICSCDHVSQVEILTSKPVMASKEELQENPRARSARLRAARVL